MRRLWFFIRAYDVHYRFQLLILFFVEKLYLIQYTRKWFSTDLVESRSLLGFIYDRNGKAKSLQDGLLIEFQVNSNQVHFHLRWNSSDFLVFNQVFIKEEYQKLTSLRHAKPVIVDAGANIGCATLYLHSFYCDALFVAIEPDEANFNALVKNVKLNHLKRVNLIRAAVWHKRDIVALTNDHRDKRQWSIKVGNTGNTEVESNTLSGILTQVGVRAPDILKMDIEGAELPVFRMDETLPSLLQATRLIGIEVHEKDTLVEQRLMQWGFACTKMGETLFAER